MRDGHAPRVRHGGRGHALSIQLRQQHQRDVDGSPTPAGRSAGPSATGTPEYCQTDATASLSTTSFDGDSSWGDYSVEADVKLYNYQSGEIGIIGHAQDASHYYRLSLKERADDGGQDWWLSRIDGGVVTVLAYRRAVFPERLLLPAQAHVLQATHPGVHLARSGPDLQYDGLCRRHAIPDREDRPDDEQHQWRVRQRRGEHAGRSQYAPVRTRRLHDARESELHEPHRQPVHAVPEFAVRAGCAAHELLCQLPPVAAQLLRADNGTELLHERRAAAGRHEPRRECAGHQEQDVEGLLHRPDDARSGVPILSRDLAESGRARQNRADLSELHARRDDRRASELLDHSRSSRDQRPRLYGCGRLHGTGGRPPEGDHRSRT